MTWGDRLRLLLRVAGHVLRSAQAVILGAFALATRWRSPRPERLLIAPQDIRTTDPTVAAEISANVFSLSGQSILLRPATAFAQPEASEAWRIRLAEFGWLRHLRRTSDPTARERARALVDVFIRTFPRPSANEVWRAEVASRRLISWLSQSPVILTTADREFYARFVGTLSLHATHLTIGLGSNFTGPCRLAAAVALANYTLCCLQDDKQQAAADSWLAREISAQVLPDGGHISRDPQIILELLLDLLPLRQAYNARNVPAPDPMVNAIDRMMPLLRLLRHGDGSIALFNGMGATAPELVATVLAYDDHRAQPLENARYAGYQRLVAADTLLIADVGLPPPFAFSQRAHAGCLAFELSSGARRIVVNCGCPATGNPETREAARSTAAHSTLTIEDTSSCRFLPSFTGLLRPFSGSIIAGPTAVEPKRSRSDTEAILDCTHDGYLAAFGLTHARQLRLHDGGNSVFGRDTLAAPGGSPPVRDVRYAIRFHLHPTVQVNQSGSFEAFLELSNGERWVFTCSQPLVIAPSVFFADARGTRATLQIVVAGQSSAFNSVDWGFTKARQAVRP